MKARHDASPLLAISQRQGGTSERTWSALETAYVDYWASYGATLIAIPNSPWRASRYLDRFHFDGIVLSGGGDVWLPSVDGSEQFGHYMRERDACERLLLDAAIDRGTPVLGICRGTQHLNVYFGGSLDRREARWNPSHNDTRHAVTVTDDALARQVATRTYDVPSHHRSTIPMPQLSSTLRPFANAADATIEGLFHPGLPIAGLMWHPERDDRHNELTDCVVKAFLARGLFWGAAR